MDDPVTDVGILADPSNCPDGYTVLTECPCGHDAQLWEKVYGGVDRTRYLCFTKKPVDTKDESEDLVIESLYIPGSGVQYLMPGYSVVARTMEGEREPLRHKQLALKKVPRSEAKKVVADVVVAKGKDDISKMFKRLEKINGVRICFRQVEYDSSKHQRPATEPITLDDLAMNTRKLVLDDHRNRTNTDFVSLTPSARQHLARKAEARAGSGNRPRSLPDIPAEGFPTPYPSSTSPTSPPLKSPPIMEEVATVQYATSLGSAPPPSTSHTTPSTEQYDSPTTDQPVKSGELSVPNDPPSNAPPPTSQYPPPGNTGGYYSGGGSQYPPGGSGGVPSYPPQPTGYQSQPYPPPAPSGGYAAQPGGFPYPAPPTTAVGYDTNIGFSFGGTQPSYPPAPPTQYPPAQYGRPPGQYPPSYPPATTQNQSAPYPAPNQQTGPRYGFNF